MTEVEWLAAADPTQMLKTVGGQTDKRKIRLYALAGCRCTEYLLTAHERRCREAIAILEKRIEEIASESELQSALDAMTGEMFGHARNPGHAAGYALFATTDAIESIRKGDWIAMTHNVSSALAYDVLGQSGNQDLERIDTLWKQGRGKDWQKDEEAVGCLPEYLAAKQVELSNQADILRDIFGNPFRPVSFSPSWRTDTTLSLARQMYESRDFGAMPILADAIQDAGCDSEDILNHCRGDGTHVRGCWVVDLVLGKE